MKVTIKKSMLQSVIKQVIKQGQDSKADYEYKKAKKRAMNMGKKNFPPFRQWKEQNGMNQRNGFETQYIDKENANTEQYSNKSEQDDKGFQQESIIDRVMNILPGLNNNRYKRDQIKQFVSFIQQNGGEKILEDYLSSWGQ